MQFSTATTALWTTLSSRAATASGRCLPSAFGMYVRRRQCPIRSSLDPCVQISEVSFKVCLVVLPRYAVHTWSRIAFSAKNDLRSRSTLTWCRSAVNFSFFLCLAACRTRSSACDTLSRPCVRCVLCSLAFLLVPALGSTGSAAGCSGIVRRLHSYYGGVRLLAVVHHRLRLLAFPMRARAARDTSAVGQPRDLRFPYKERLHMPGSATTPGRRGARAGAPVRFAFH